MNLVSEDTEREDAERKQQILAFFKSDKHFLSQLLSYMAQPDDSMWAPIEISLDSLVIAELVGVAEWIRYHPMRAFPLIEEALMETQESILRQQANVPGATPLSLKQRVRVRFLPLDKTVRGVLPKNSDVGELVAVRGTVIRTSQPTILEWRRRYVCTKCGYEFYQQADITSAATLLPVPTTCGSRATNPPCNSKSFRVLDTEMDTKDFQEIKIQEQVHKLTVGSLPKTMIVLLMEDLVDTCKAGDDVIIHGVVLRRWQNLYEGERADCELIMVANHISVNNENKFGQGVTEELRVKFERYWEQNKSQPLKARNEILKAICPETFGLAVVKLAVALVLAGGVPMQTANGTRVRGESHLLLVGDPGTGKSQLLKFAAKIANRSVLTTGVGTTGAGLTVTAMKDKGGTWTLEAGALVLADGGVCCIDEFGSIKEHDRTTIHEAMEQQSLSVAKAGLVCKLQTRCSIIGATNPKGRFNASQSISANTGIEPPLLSRFDLVMVMLDESNQQWDQLVSSYILRERETQHKVKSDDSDGFVWTLEILQAYFSYIKATISPRLTPEAKTILKEYYLKQRRSDMADAARTTVRLLESLIRLAQAHAKLMCRHEVLIVDAVTAVYVMEASTYSSTMLGGISTVRSMFPEDPDADYYRIEAKILKMLNLMHLCSRPSQIPSQIPSQPGL